jgi:hypothetical protein
LRTAIAIDGSLIGEHFGRDHAGARRGWPTIAGDPENAALFQPLRDARGGVTGVQPNRGDVKTEALALAVEPAEIDDRVMTPIGVVCPIYTTPAALTLRQAPNCARYDNPPEDHASKERMDASGGSPLRCFPFDIAPSMLLHMSIICSYERGRLCLPLRACSSRSATPTIATT